MFGQYTDLDEFLTETPSVLIPLERLYQHHDTHLTSDSPLHAFIYLVRYGNHSELLPYDYVPNGYFGFMEQELLGMALVAYSDHAEYATRWLDHLVYLCDKQDIDLSDRTSD
jgi:hypothetical protein